VVAVADQGEAFVLADGRLTPAPSGVAQAGTRLVIGPLVVDVMGAEA
jgi:hypothetical protein